LKRLISASSSASWGESYGYDAFGNLLSKTPTAGSPPTLSQAVNPANNQIVGQTYDANGNQLSAPAGGTLTYDPENRLLTAPGIQYAYDSQNKRVWAGTLNGSGNLTAQAVFVYGVRGQMLGEYSITVGSSSLTLAMTNLSEYFGSKRIGVTNSSGVTSAFAPDRLGSAGQYYTYGEGKGGNNPADSWSFATYWRDSATGLDYANRRFYSNQIGRFMSPDPYRGSAHGGNPQSWNRYGYVLGDPVNGNDPSGLDPLEDQCSSDDGGCDGDSASGGPNSGGNGTADGGGDGSTVSYGSGDINGSYCTDDTTGQPVPCSDGNGNLNPTGVETGVGPDDGSAGTTTVNAPGATLVPPPWTYTPVDPTDISDIFQFPTQPTGKYSQYLSCVGAHIAIDYTQGAPELLTLHIALGRSSYRFGNSWTRLQHKSDMH
jgi:RHS repeat-associated protein